MEKCGVIHSKTKISEMMQAVQLDQSRTLILNSIWQIEWFHLQSLQEPKVPEICLTCLTISASAEFAYKFGYYNSQLAGYCTQGNSEHLVVLKNAGTLHVRSW